MIARCESLSRALEDVERGALSEVSTVVVSRQWWDGLSLAERNAFRQRAHRAGVDLRADSAMSVHFVELRGGADGPPLSTERPM